MRKILICCTLGLVASAVAVQCWARQAMKAPDSLAGQSFQALTRAVTLTHPMMLINAVTAKHAPECTTCKAIEESAVQFEIPEELIRQHAEERIRELKLFPSNEIIAVEASTCHNSCCEGSASCEVIVVQGEAVGCGVAYPEGRGSEACEEEAPAYMPPAKEYSDEDMSDPEQPLSFWLKIFTDVLEQQAKVEEPADTVSPEDMGKPEEDPNYHHQYPGCPYTGCNRGECCPSCQTEEAVAPSCTNVKKHLWISLFPPAVWLVPAQEEGVGITAFPIVMGGAAAACEGKAEEQHLGTRDLESVRKRYRDLGSDRVPTEADVDTMEYRPSDGRKGEFNRIPY